MKIRTKFICALVVAIFFLIAISPNVFGAPGAFVNICGTNPPSGNWSQHNSNPSCSGCSEGQGCYGTVVALCVCDCGEQLSNIECRANCRNIGSGASFAGTFNDDCLMYQMDVYSDRLFGTVRDFAVWKGDRFCDPSCVPQTPTPTPTLTPTISISPSITPLVTFPQITPTPIVIYPVSPTPVIITPSIIPLPKTNLIQDHALTLVFSILIFMIGIFIYKFEVFDYVQWSEFFYNVYYQGIDKFFFGTKIFDKKKIIKKSQQKFEKKLKKKGK